jgi:hypothetical protein
VDSPSQKVRAERFERRHSAALETLRRWLNQHLEQFVPDQGGLGAPAVKPAADLLLILRGLRGAGADPVVAHWVDGVVSRLWDPIELWLRRLEWGGLVELARARSRLVANLLVVPLLEDLAGRRSIAHEQVRHVFAEIRWREPGDHDFDLAFACDLTDVRPSRSLAELQLRRLLENRAALETQPSAYYDLTHAVFLRTSMGRRPASCPPQLRPRFDRCLTAGLVSRLGAADFDLACELAIAAQWFLHNPSASLQACIDATQRTVADVIDAHGFVPCFQNRAEGFPRAFERRYHPVLVALLALAWATDRRTRFAEA